MIAAHQGNEEIVKLLLKHNPNSSLKDKYGKTAIGRAKTVTIKKLIENFQYNPTRTPKKTKSVTSFRSRTSIMSDPVYKQSGITPMQARKKIEKKVKKEVTKEIDSLIESEISKGENCIRDVIGSEMQTLTTKIKQNIETQLIYKFGESGGVGEVFEDVKEKYVQNEPINCDNMETIKKQKSQSKDQKDSKEQGTGSSSGLLKVFTITPKEISEKNESPPEPEPYPPTEMQQNLGIFSDYAEFIKIVAKQMAVSHITDVKNTIESRLDSLEHILRNDLKDVISNMTKEIYTKMDKLYLEKCKQNRLNSRSPSISPKNSSIVSANKRKSVDSNEKLEYLQSSIVELETQYKNMISSGDPQKYIQTDFKTRSKSVSKNHPNVVPLNYPTANVSKQLIEQNSPKRNHDGLITRRQSASAVLLTQSSVCLSNNFDGYKSIQDQIRENSEKRVDYKYIEPHIAKVTPRAASSKNVSSISPISELPNWDNSEVTPKSP